MHFVVLLARRLAAQQISRHAHTAPSSLVAWLVAVQAQDFAGSKWALALRVSGKKNEVAIERALDRGHIVRTHALRGTWQFVTPRDARWLTRLGAARILRKSAARHRQLGLAQRELEKSGKTLARALKDRDSLTRSELAAALERAGIATTGPRLSHMLLAAELNEVICGGPRRGKEFAYASFDRVAPATESMPTGPDAHAMLAERYFKSRGPATLGDFAWWSGLNLGEARLALEAVTNGLESEVIDETTYYFASGAKVRSRAGVWLLPAFDEWLIAYRDRDATLAPEHSRRVNAGGGMLDPCIVVDGRVAGIWRRVLSRNSVEVDLYWFSRPRPSEVNAAAEAAGRYAAFLGLTPKITQRSFSSGGKRPPLRSRGRRA